MFTSGIKGPSTMRFALGFVLFAALTGSCSEKNALLDQAKTIEDLGAVTGPDPSQILPHRMDGQPLNFGGKNSLTAGEHHSCVVSDGAVYCWGYGLAGQLGLGDMQNRAKPVMIEALGQDNQKVFTGDLHSCAIKQSGAVYCWGYNQTGAVGNGRSGREFTFSGQAKLYNVTSPTRVLGLDGLKIVQIAATKITSCALDDQGDVHCWGTGANYELGDGEKDNAATRVAHHIGAAQKVSVLEEPAKEIHAGDRAFCAVTISHEIKCWGTLSLPTERAYPLVDLSAAHIPLSLAMADQHSCFVTATQQLYCRGDNWYQQTGLATVANVWTRVNGESFTKIATARKTTCGITPNRSVRCWGVCLHGLCGPQFTAKLISPTQAQNVFAYTTQRSIEIEGLTGAVEIAVGARHACALLENGQIKCWGNGFLGELGDGEGQSSAEPVDVAF
jgi:alpha-tubulin suppressor-like RCC1 family protein